MNTSMLRTLVTLCVAGLLLSVAAQQPWAMPDAGPGPGDIPPPPDAAAMSESPASVTNGPPPADNPSAAPTTDVQSATPDKSAAAIVPAVVQDSALAPTIGTNFDELRLNFHNAPLEMVLNYLSEAAGFIIVLDTQVHGNVSVISNHPMNRNEAVDLLNAVLNKNGYAAIRDGRTLTILDKNEAKTRNIPVKTSNDPDKIPNNAEIVTQIIPIRFVEARQLVTDLSSFVSPQATIVANEAGNSVVVTDTQSNIRHLTEIIRAIDNSAEGETEIRVFHLNHASPTDVASELGQIFPSSSSTSGTRFRRPSGSAAGGVAALVAVFQAFPALAGRRQYVRQQWQSEYPDPKADAGRRRGGFAHFIRHCDRLEGFDAGNRRDDGTTGRAFRSRSERLCLPDEKWRSAAGVDGAAKHVPEQQHFAQRHEFVVAEQRAPATRCERHHHDGYDHHHHRGRRHQHRRRCRNAGV